MDLSPGTSAARSARTKRTRDHCGEGDEPQQRQMTVSLTKKAKDDGAAEQGNIDTFLEGIDQKRFIDILLKTPIRQEGDLAKALRFALKETKLWNLSNIPDNVWISFEEGHRRLSVTTEARKKLEQDGSIMANGAFNAVLSHTEDCCSSQREASARPVIGQFLIAAVTSVNQDIRDDTTLRNDLKLRLSNLAGFAKAETPRAILSFESNIVASVSDNVIFKGMVDYVVHFVSELDLADFCGGDSGPMSGDHVHTSMILMEVKSLTEFNGPGRLQAKAAAAVMCNITNRDFSTSVLTNGERWRFFIIKRTRSESGTTYFSYETPTYLKRDSPAVIVGLVKLAILQDPASIIAFLENENAVGAQLLPDSAGTLSADSYHSD